MPLPLFLAPMAELSHRALRELIEVFGGCDEYFSEMLSAGAVVSGGPYERYYLDSGPCPSRLVYQLCGSQKRTLVNAAKILNQTDALGIDINMGCSAPVIVKSGAGAAWLKNKDDAAAMVHDVRMSTSKRLSVKLRIGLSDDFENLLDFCKALENEGVDLITLHPRTIKEKFKRTVRWNYVERLSAALSIPVAGNGDINTIELCQTRAASSSCAALMIGRFAVRCPWVFAKVKNAAFSTPVDIEEIALLFLQLLAQFQPPEFFVSRARRFFRYYCENVIWGNYLQNLLNRAQTLSEYERIVCDFFQQHPDSIRTVP